MLDFKFRLIGVLTSCALLTACASDVSQKSRTFSVSAPVTIVAIGDMPYRSKDIAPFEALLGEINAIGPDVTIHVGDIKGGGSPCTDSLFEEQRDHMDSVAGPLVYTPGDNEWTDCHRTSAGRHDPQERLSVLRKLFFPTDKSRGESPIALVRQADIDPNHPGLVENARWQMNGVRFVTAHVVGSNNGFNPEVTGARDEYLARDAANGKWIRDSFAVARSEGAAVVVLAFQADPFLKLGIGGGFRNTLAAISDGVERFDGPVLVLMGDGHVYTIDTPFHDRQGGIRENVVRLIVPGAADIRAVRIRIDPEARQIFTFEPFGPGNADQRG